MQANLQTATAAIVGTFTAMTAAKDFDLRKIVRGAGGKYRVLKNKLAPKAGAGTQIEGALGGLKGVSSIAYTSGDPVALAKALATWIKDNAQFTFKLGIVDGKVLSSSRSMNSQRCRVRTSCSRSCCSSSTHRQPALATVLNATGRNLAVVIDQAVQQEKFAAGEPVAAAAPAVEDAPAAEATPATEEAPAAVAASTDADPAQPEDGADSQAGAAATEEPAEGA